MRTRIDTMTFTAGTRAINSGVSNLTIPDIRLIINETQKQVICSSMQKDNIVSIANGVVTYKDTIPVLASGDKITFEIDQCKSEVNYEEITSEEIIAMANRIIS